MIKPIDSLNGWNGSIPLLQLDWNFPSYSNQLQEFSSILSYKLNHKKKNDSTIEYYARYHVIYEYFMRWNDINDNVLCYLLIWSYWHSFRFQTTNFISKLIGSQTESTFSWIIVSILYKAKLQSWERYFNILISSLSHIQAGIITLIFRMSLENQKEREEEKE